MHQNVGVQLLRKKKGSVQAKQEMNQISFFNKTKPGKTEF
jgi:hypothetical protein